MQDNSSSLAKPLSIRTSRGVVRNINEMRSSYAPMLAAMTIAPSFSFFARPPHGTSPPRVVRVRRSITANEGPDSGRRSFVATAFSLATATATLPFVPQAAWADAGASTELTGIKIEPCVPMLAPSASNEHESSVTSTLLWDRQGTTSWCGARWGRAGP